jgi:hypothetical protein
MTALLTSWMKCDTSHYTTGQYAPCCSAASPRPRSAAHRSLSEHLASNQRRAEALGWTAFVLERGGGSRGLTLRATPPTGLAPELVPHAILNDVPEPSGLRATCRMTKGHRGPT